jgi:hypothetical protein
MGGGDGAADPVKGGRYEKPDGDRPHRAGAASFRGSGCSFFRLEFVLMVITPVRA